eukprot:CAMPEP_0175165612 /NCGR_PEP_ID=MMETSP0087-20121206/27193_1 /TAXON_ID=136419 /ORGANISM="Unknown Unknown, Strain D1" /LENGTH=320 /DNA_ID=CAMNT_0016455029 /DNA_START=70 /DNA_END=1032 /DNA_ORIENTATION=+
MAAAVYAATCANTGADYTYTETVDGTTRTIVWSGCPNHFYGTGMNPNSPVKGSTTYKIPKSPMLQPAGTTVDLSAQGGAIGLTFAGEQIYSPYGGAKYGATTNYATTAVKNEGDTFDMCGGHSSSNTQVSYHIHIPPSCLLRQLSAQDNAHSPQIGWAFDGFPVYGPRGASGKMMKKCTIDSTAPCLDECGGIASAYEGYNYRYHIQGPYNNGTDCSNPNSQMKPLDATVWTSYYPHSPICFRGCIPSGVTGLTFNKLIACSGSATAGSSSPKAAQAALAVNDKPVCSSYAGAGKFFSSAPSTHSPHAGVFLAVAGLVLL